MILSLLVIAVTLAVGYVWLSRGLFSALLNLICVIAAGAIAFGLWEPLSMMLVESAPRSGFLGFIGSGSWAIGLLLPFAISLALLRVVSDSVVKANTKVPAAVDMAGGAVCGLASGVIVMGIVVIGASYARLPTAVFGYEPIEVDRGSLVNQGSLLLPADKLVAGMYSHLSNGALRSGEQLGYWYPELTTAGWRTRVNHGGGKSMNVINGDQFSVSGRYTVAAESPMPIQQLLGPDEWYTNAQTATGLDGQPLSGLQYIEGFKIDFEASARESFGQVVMSAGQARLLCERADGTTYEVHPVALVSVADAAQRQFARFRYMSRDAISAEGAGDATMAFEFPVEAGSEAVALYLKNFRVDVREEMIESAFATPQLRNAAIRTGSLMGGINVLAALDLTDAVPIDSSANVGAGAANVLLGETIPGRRVLQEGQEGGLSVNESNEIFAGTTTLDPSSFSRAGVITKELRIANFALPPETGMVQVNVAANSPLSFANEVDAIAKLTPDQRTKSPPVLIDVNGATYAAVGYVYEDQTKILIRYEPGDPVASLDEMRRAGVEVSRNNPDQQLTLLFLTTAGVDIEMMAIGDKVTAVFEPPFTTQPPRRRR